MSLVFAVDSKRALPELCQQSSKNVEKCYRRFSNSRLTGDAALFLFDQTVAEYLTWIFSTAVGRRTVRVVQSEPDHSASFTRKGKLSWRFGTPSSTRKFGLVSSVSAAGIGNRWPRRTPKGASPLCYPQAFVKSRRG